MITSKDAFSLSSEQAKELYPSLDKSGTVFSNQTTGFASSTADDFVTQTINKASENTVNMLDKNSLRYFNDLKGTGQFPNNQAVLDEVLSNQATKYQGLTDFDGKYVTDLSKTGD